MARVRYHWLRLRAVAHPTEDVARVRHALQWASGLGGEEFAAALKATPMDTHHGLTITILEATVDRSRALRDVLDRVFSSPAALDRLRATLEARVDDDGIYYFRADKQAAFLGELRLADVEDAIQFRLKLETYPATRDAALAALRALLADGKA